MKKPSKTKIRVDWRVDGVMQTDKIRTKGKKFSVAVISDDGRGYVHVPYQHRVYRRIERVVVTFGKRRKRRR